MILFSFIKTIFYRNHLFCFHATIHESSHYAVCYKTTFNRIFSRTLAKHSKVKPLGLVSIVQARKNQQIIRDKDSH